MTASRRAAWILAVSGFVAACGGGGGGGGEPPPPPNEPPVMNLPSQLTGGGSTFRFTLPVADSTTLHFTASDPNDDPLRWQLVGAGAAAVGVTIPQPVPGPAFDLDVAVVTLPAAADLVLLVEDSHGLAAAIDLKIVRTGPPSITGVAPGSAFRSSPHPVTITGAALSLGGTAGTAARFGPLLGTSVTTPNESTLRCTTPAGMAPGPTVVKVSNLHGEDELPASAFTAYTYPPVFPVADQALDSGAGSAPAVAQDGERVHAAWLEGGAVVHRASTDGGATWGVAQTLSGGEVPTEPAVAVVGDDVVVAWIGDGSSLQTRRSTDGGASFLAAQVLNPLAGGQASARPRLAAGGNHRYTAWLAGDAGLGLARVAVAVSDDGGATWSAPAAVDDGGANQAEHVLVADGQRAWLAFTDLRQGAGVVGAYTTRTLDGGQTWLAATRRSPAGTSVGAPRLCADANWVHVTWLRGGVLDYVWSDNAGFSWTTVPLELSDSAAAAASAPAIACEGPFVFAAYVVGGTATWVARVTGLGSQPQRVQVSTATVTAASPCIHQRANYVFVAWRSDDVGTGLARIQQSVSIDLGQTFTPPAGFGDGTAAQELPQLLVDGARMTLVWLDHRGGTPALFATRNNP